jgi:K+-transporting ATPase ATPase A chain
MIQGFIQIGLTLLVLVIIVPFFGKYMAKIYLQQKTFLDPVLSPLERIIDTISGVNTQQEMTGWQYAKSILFSNLVMGIFVFLIFALQGSLPLNSTDCINYPF